MGAYLAFPGRIEREDWIGQASALAAGDTTEFSVRAAATGLYADVAPVSADAALHPGVAPAAQPVPEDGFGDDLTLIFGIGPVIAAKLNAAGLWRFEHVAALTDDEITWISDHVGFPGRGIRENWRGDAAILAVGGETEHSIAIKAKRLDGG
jgi:predicted flap endonuclease-1-like 5' DNA nuclease